MWFIFPQIAGPGFSATAQRFALGARAGPSVTWSMTFSDRA
jgi:uncharacterized protein (DUF1810 family)